MTVDAARYRTYFEDARKRAEQVSDPVEKQAWLRMAEKWFKLLLWRNSTLRRKHPGRF
jgi:hypothetical protein